MSAKSQKKEIERMLSKGWTAAEIIEKHSHLEEGWSLVSAKVKGEQLHVLVGSSGKVGEVIEKYPQLAGGVDEYMKSIAPKRAARGAGSRVPRSRISAPSIF